MSPTASSSDLGQQQRRDNNGLLDADMLPGAVDNTMLAFRPMRVTAVDDFKPQEDEEQQPSTRFRLVDTTTTTSTSHSIRRSRGGGGDDGTADAPGRGSPGANSNSSVNIISSAAAPPFDAMSAASSVRVLGDSGGGMSNLESGSLHIDDAATTMAAVRGMQPRSISQSSLCMDLTPRTQQIMRDVSGGGGRGGGEGRGARTLVLGSCPSDSARPPVVFGRGGSAAAGDAARSRRRGESDNNVPVRFNPEQLRQEAERRHQARLLLPDTANSKMAETEDERRRRRLSRTTVPGANVLEDNVSAESSDFGGDDDYETASSNSTGASDSTFRSSDDSERKQQQRDRQSRRANGSYDSWSSDNSIQSVLSGVDSNPMLGGSGGAVAAAAAAAAIAPPRSVSSCSGTLYPSTDHDCFIGATSQGSTAPTHSSTGSRSDDGADIPHVVGPLSGVVTCGGLENAGESAVWRRQ